MPPDALEEAQHLAELEAQELALRLQKEADDAERARLDRLRQEADQHVKEAKAVKAKAAAYQRKLRVMGTCVQGFAWLDMGSGFRCAGESHYMSKAALDSM